MGFRVSVLPSSQSILPKETAHCPRYLQRLHINLRFEEKAYRIQRGRKGDFGTCLCRMPLAEWSIWAPGRCFRAFASTEEEFDGLRNPCGST